MPHSFDDSLLILPAGPLTGAGLEPGTRLGVCAMGPVAAGDKVLSMRVWIFQQVGTQVAAASGEGGKHLGGHDPVPEEDLPFKGPKWMIQTQLEKDSDQFAAGDGALATAMALVEHEDRTKDVMHWSRAVMIGPEHTHH
jgi:hypothetical protein